MEVPKQTPLYADAQPGKHILSRNVPGRLPVCVIKAEAEAEAAAYQLESRLLHHCPNVG